MSLTSKSRLVGLALLSIYSDIKISEAGIFNTFVNSGKV
jgi:hypothetical protein